MRRKVPPAPDSDWTDPVRSLAFLSPGKTRTCVRFCARHDETDPFPRIAGPHVRQSARVRARSSAVGGRGRSGLADAARGPDDRRPMRAPASGISGMYSTNIRTCRVFPASFSVVFRTFSAACVPDATSASAPGPYAPVAGRLCELMLPVPHGGACRAAAPGELARRSARRFR